MPLDHFVTLGRSGLRVSPLCLGAMTFGEEWAIGANVELSRRLLDAYIDRGGNFIDTANIYNKGHSEKIIGDHISHDRARRDRLVLATKFLGNLHPRDPNGGGAHRKSIVAACEQSLRRLRTDYIDLYWMHFHDRFTPIDETMRALDDLVREGKIRYVGFSDTPAWVCAQAQVEARFRGWSPCIALQIEYSLLERTVEGELVPMAIEMGMGITPWSPLKGGILSGKYTRGGTPAKGEARHAPDSRHLNDRTWAIVDNLADVARRHQSTPARIALAWVQGRPGIASTIIGARSVAQLEDNLAALEVRLSPQEVGGLDALSAPTLNFPHEFLQNIAPVIHGGMTINGSSAPPWPLAPATDADRY